MLLKKIKAFFAEKTNRVKWLCPWHQEETPSLVVDYDTKTFHCFGCGRSGSLDEFREKLWGGVE